MNIEVSKKEVMQFSIYSLFVLGAGLSTGTLLQLDLSQGMKLLIGQGLVTSVLAGIVAGYKIRGETTE